MLFALLALIVVLALLGWGIAGAVHFLVWIAIIAFIFWLAMWFIGGIPGGRRGYWRRW